MRIENPAALRFIIEDDLYLLNKDKLVIPVPIPAPAPAVATPVLPPPIVETAALEFKYMGNNKKNFLIIVHYADNEFIDKAHLTSLENILKRKDLLLDDVAIFNIHNYAHIDMEEISNYFKPSKLLVMGSKAIPQKTSSATLNQPVQMNGYMCLYSLSFDEMMSSNENKKAFWDQMKNL